MGEMNNMLFDLGNELEETTNVDLQGLKHEYMLNRFVADSETRLLCRHSSVAKVGT